MRYVCVILLFALVNGKLWKNGIVHYTINSKDYDVHSQDIITSAFAQIQNELCVKFFQAPLNYNTSDDQKILYVNNPDKLKTCSFARYDFTKNVISPASSRTYEMGEQVETLLVRDENQNKCFIVNKNHDMPIGYKCLNQREIVRLVVDMLKASIDPSGSSPNSYDLIKKFQENESYMPNESLISATDRNYINLKYQTECGFMAHPQVIQRRIGNETDSQMSAENYKYYMNKLWPLGIVLYGVDPDLKSSQEYRTLKQAMSTIELLSCVVFQEYVPDDVVVARNYIWFGNEGDDMPLYGFNGGKQKINLSAFLVGAPGHKAHSINSLLRILGIHMMSNRYDRDNYVVVHWRNVESAKGQYLEKAAEEAWVKSIPYDFDSITHAPANYMCDKCELGQTTVQPIQDHLWQRTLSIGHRSELSASDVRLIDLLYAQQCRNRYNTN